MRRNRVLSIPFPRFLVILAVVLILGFYLGIRLGSAPNPNGAAGLNATGDGPRLSPIFTAEVLYWSPLIKAWGQAYQIDPNLIATVMQIESCGDPTAVSTSGAQGLFQVMPFHFTPGEDMQNVAINGQRGVQYLAEALKAAGGDPGLALAGYNGGLGVISGGWAHWSNETRRYYQWGIGIYKDAATAQTTSSALQAWLNAGGQRLCQHAQARQAVAMN